MRIVRQPGGLGLLGASSLLVAVGAGCSSSESPSSDLRTAFPDHVQEITASRRGFDDHVDSFVLRPDVDRWGPSLLQVWLPKASLEPVRMRLDAIGLDIAIHELDVAGEGERDGEAVRYARAGGLSYWSGVPGGVEEWLVLDAGVSDYGTPVASWIVGGATLHQEGPAVVVYDAVDGRARIRVTADRAYGPDGEALGTQLRVVGDRIDLFVAESAGPVLVDPSWVDLATLQVGRFWHASTLLNNGTVLTAGGVGAFGIENSAETYDPVTATWTAVAPLNIWRLAHTLTTLDDGTAIAHGGEDGTTFPVYDPEIWDPTANGGLGDWVIATSGGSICQTAGYHTATKLADGSGRVLFAGGIFEWSVKSGGNDGDPCSELWDPLVGGYVTPTDPYMNDWRYKHAATLLMSGDVLVSGGEDNGFEYDSAEIWDVTTEQWGQVEWMNESRSQHTLTTLCNGDVLAAGGYGSLPSANGLGPQGNAHASAEIYDPVNDTWNYTNNNMSTPRYAHTASLLPDCRVLVVGGLDASGGALATVEIYDPATGMWTLQLNDPITGARSHATATALGNGGILVAGGYEDVGGTAVATSMVYQSLLADGEPCTVGGDCNSGYCVDGVCCDGLCDSDCEACTAALQGGGVDGTCGPVASGTDPDGNCSDQGLATCGTNGACDGSGVCAVYALGTVCNPAACNGDDVVNADTCNGDPASPSCVDNASTDCGAYTCSAAVCLTSCATITDCAGQHYCDTSTETCVPQLSNGEMATLPDQCLSGIVADGVCCDAACDNGVCDACTVAGGGTVDGTCTAIITCSDANECTLDACHPVSGCVSNNVLDGASCGGGICVAGTCIPDPDVTPSGAGGAIGSGSGSGGAGSDSTGAAGKLLGDPRLEGGGICQATVAGGSSRSNEAALWWLLALAPLVRRRRSRAALR